MKIRRSKRTKIREWKQQPVQGLKGMKIAKEVNNAEAKERMARWCKLWCLGRDDRRPTRSSDFDGICAGRCGSSPVPTAWPCLYFGIEPRQKRRWEKRPRGRVWREMHGRRRPGLRTRREKEEEIAGSRAGDEACGRRGNTAS